KMRMATPLLMQALPM
nr:Chain C, HLA class II histocompatibility antigen gamma chain [Homo sapiens]3PGC_F Chain F, HLA class II histocompatibility antigen gamma chain [Homo sapiens]3PGD_C Chain C, HLA class II histocompatibility antigen gamma chain [Homo sapiens]3PGD_F Chain F, HLA class II histocompatibility antigen gamma chain [Homo sapiens]